jgi:hypothetical protein
MNAKLASSENTSVPLQNQQLTAGERKPKRRGHVADIFIAGFVFTGAVRRLSLRHPEGEKLPAANPRPAAQT